ncbi:NitT/TauT family transport system permease protein [Noviherbaspirillum humi]|uniref:NitT/TauT family transport system permease protein n=2 Tax=Noviherbaspirillum humi TaxID=1688639 RepID=A0A239HPX5_9BURK|nr:NitT/TauT family transport system permease protein [Noviherbaspirillum humi]
MSRAMNIPMKVTPAQKAAALRKPLLASPRMQAVLAPMAVGALLLLLWQMLCTVLDVPVYLVPSPAAIFRTLVADWALLFGALLTTLRITFLAFALAVVIGVAVAFLFVQSRVLEAALFPYAILLQVTPIVAIAPLIIIWVKTPVIALTLCATMMALFPIISNTVLGLRSVQPSLLNLFRLNRASRWQILVRLRIPSALPSFFGGLRISSGLSLIGAVVAEFVAGTGGTSTGLAYQILQAGFELNIPRLFAALLMITVTGVLLFALMVALSRACLSSWHESELE